MIKNYFKIAWRNILRHKAFAGINIFGLALGIAACLLILQYVSFELSYEKFHTNKDRIYRVQQDRLDNGRISTQWVAGAYAVGNSFKEAIPEIEDYVKIVNHPEVVAGIANQPIKISNVFFASGSFFKIFTYPLSAGNKGTALTEPFTAAVSQRTALKIFGSTNVIGKTLALKGYDQDKNYKITAVFKDPPANTQLKPDLLISYATFLKEAPADYNPETAWTSDGCLTYLLLHKDADPKSVEAKFIPVVEKAVGEQLKRFNSSVTYHLQPLKDIHLYSNYMGEPSPNGDGKTVYLLLGVAFFIIVIAWVNDINLATARALSRAREVGIRKAVGSHRRQLMVQFLSESALLNGLALVLGLIIVVVAMPYFNQLSGQEHSLGLFTKKDFWLALLILFITGIFFSGLYPAFVLSGFKPIDVLKGKLVSSKQGVLLRKSLVVFQFAASLFLLIGTLTVYKQIQYMRQQSLGADIDQTLIVKPPIVRADSTYVDQVTALKQTLLQQSSIKSITESTSIFGEPVFWNAGGVKLTGTGETTQKQYRVIGIDYDFIPAYGLKVIAGRNFSKDFGADDKAVIFNRKGIEQLGFNNPHETIGKKIDFWREQYTIAGVTENFHHESLREAFVPMIFRLIPEAQGYLSLKVQTSQISEIVNIVKANWNKFFPGNTFEYFFLDEHFNEQYKADQRFGKVFGLFTGLSILVACMGLFALASFTTVQRTKEIGIRKVLGASVSGILRLLYSEFTVLLLLSFAVAAPLAWLMVSDWLQDYAFRITIHWSYFILPFAVIIAIALVTVSFQTIKAAIANPVKSLRTE